MKAIHCLSLSFLVCLLVTTKNYAQTHSMALVKGGTYKPIYGKDSTRVVVKSFYMDVYPVTNEEYLLFTKSHPEWKKSNVKKIFADGNYLSNWMNDSSLGTLSKTSPITNVSWFAGTEYCKCQGKRLPTLDEWEYVAMANESMPDARLLENYNKYILSWYETPKTYSNQIGKTYKNYWGIYDMHGLVWEWISDFNSVMMTGESRKDGSNDRALFCGSASLGASDLMNYAAFMRYAFRGSIKAKYNIQNLGFRCVKDIPKK